MELESIPTYIANPHSQGTLFNVDRLSTLEPRSELFHSRLVWNKHLQDSSSEPTHLGRTIRKDLGCCRGELLGKRFYYESPPNSAISSIVADRTRLPPYGLQVFDNPTYRPSSGITSGLPII